MGDVSRRAVLGASISTLGLVAFGIGAPGAEAAAKSSTKPLARGAAKPAPASEPVRADYAHLIGRVFTVTRDGHAYRIKLTHLHNLPATTAKQHPHCFALIFAPVGKARLKDGVYLVRRSGTRTHKLFLSSVGSHGGMQAIVNRSH
jgi:hypothetical protein